MRFWRRKASAPAPDAPIIVCEGVTRSFGATHVLRGVDLAVKPGTLVALYGPSGSGKTTLLNLIGALDTPSRGKITLAGMEVSAMRERRRAKLRRTKLGFIFQNYTLMPTYTALENLDLALRLSGIGVLERRRRAKLALESVGLSAWASHVPDELSGGQRQRVAIARALAVRPAIVLADEPTSGLDTRTTKRILSLFRHIAHEQGTTFVIVSHDPLVAAHVDAAYDLNDGKLTRRVTELPHPPLARAEERSFAELPDFLGEDDLTFKQAEVESSADMPDFLTENDLIFERESAQLSGELHATRGAGNEANNGHSVDVGVSGADAGGGRGDADAGIGGAAAGGQPAACSDEHAAYGRTDTADQHAAALGPRPSALGDQHAPASADVRAADLDAAPAAVPSANGVADHRD